MKELFPQSIKNIYHLGRSIFSAVWFWFPARKIKVIGVTGTNGKTTTVQMVAGILEEAGYKVAVSSTINFKIGKEEWVNKTKFTTRSGWYTQKFIHQAVKADCEYLVLETASHALDQNRLWGIKFDVAVITNVTREHLDYHKTIKEYREAKMKLFGMLKKDGTVVVNLGMERPEEFLGILERAKKYCYAVQAVQADQRSKIKDQNSNSKCEIIEAGDVELNSSDTLFRVDEVAFRLNLPGQFNIENALAAICVCLSQDVDLKIASQALEEITVVPGRMDRVENDRGIEIIIDYAVTPDSMEKLGKHINEIKKDDTKVIWVFGSCGERDRGKRPIMGKIVTKHADQVIVTNEDPYGEKPERIIDEVFAGVIEGGKQENKNAFVVSDRREAIKKAIKMAGKGDIILITGKGAEETMAIGKKRLPWNDKEVVRKIFLEMDN